MAQESTMGSRVGVFVSRILIGALFVATVFWLWWSMGAWKAHLAYKEKWETQTQSDRLLVHEQRRSEHFGQMGDSIGGIAGAIGLIGALTAILLQSRELQLQREEMSSMRKINMDREHNERTPIILARWELAQDGMTLWLINAGRGTARIKSIALWDRGNGKHKRDPCGTLKRDPSTRRCLGGSWGYTPMCLCHQGCCPDGAPHGGRFLAFRGIVAGRRAFVDAQGAFTALLRRRALFLAACRR